MRVRTLRSEERELHNGPATEVFDDHSARQPPLVTSVPHLSRLMAIGRDHIPYD